jgi:hypothetical protein
MSVAVIGYNDRQVINACLLYRFSMSYEPRDFHGQLDEMPVSLSYGRAVDDLRRRYREWIWDAEFRDTLGAQVTAGGAPLDTYTVFRRKDGLRAVVLANMSDTDSIVCEVTLDHPAPAGLKLVSPEQPDPRPWPGKLELAPGSAAVLLEG